MNNYSDDDAYEDYMELMSMLFPRKPKPEPKVRAWVSLPLVGEGLFPFENVPLEFCHYIGEIDGIPVYVEIL